MRYVIAAGCAALSGLMLPTLAAAQETTADAPFTGAYVGGSIGWSVQPNDVGEFIEFDRNGDGNFGDAVSTAAGANAFSPGFCNGAARGATPGGCANDRNGLDYYGRLGFDIQRGRFVAGVVGEFGKARINDSVSGYSTTPASYTLRRSLEWEASIRGRVGVALDTTLFYGTAGPGYAKLNNEFFTTNTANAFATNGDDKRWGLTAGGGLEQKITKNISFGMEYMFHRYKDDDFRVNVTRGSAPATNPFVLAPNTGGTQIRRGFDYFRWHSIRGTLAFRF
jgi:outer membrane immunogenic protein